MGLAPIYYPNPRIGPPGWYDSNGNYVNPPGYLPPGSSQSGTRTTTGNQSGSYNETDIGEIVRSLPPEVRSRYLGLIDQLLGDKNYGYSPEELARMDISPEEGRLIQREATLPIIGAGDKARTALMGAAAARGNYAPGLNAAVERVQQEQGRQSSDAFLSARLGIEEQRRQVAQAAANARIGQQIAQTGQVAGLLSSYPEGTQSSTGSRSGTNTSTGREEVEEERESTGGSGGGGSGGGGGVLGPGGTIAPPTGAMPKDNSTGGSATTTTPFGGTGKRPRTGYGIVLPQLP